VEDKNNHHLSSTNISIIYWLSVYNFNSR